MCIVQGKKQTFDWDVEHFPFMNNLNSLIEALFDFFAWGR